MPPVLDLKAAAQLRAGFLKARGNPLEVDASQVERIGGLCLQILLAARAAWEADGQRLTFEPVSPGLEAGLELLGAKAALLPEGEGSG